MRGRLISTGCKAAVAGGKRRRRGKKKNPPPPPTKLAESKREGRNEERSSSRRRARHLLCTARRSHSRSPTCSSGFPPRRSPGSPGGARAARPAGVGGGRCGPGGEATFLLPAPGLHAAPSSPPPPNLSHPEVPPRCLCQHGRSGEGKILIKQSPPRNGRKRKCQCRGGRGDLKKKKNSVLKNITKCQPSAVLGGDGRKQDGLAERLGQFLLN